MDKVSVSNFYCVSIDYKGARKKQVLNFRLALVTTVSLQPQKQVSPVREQQGDSPLFIINRWFIVQTGIQPKES
jgi:hypothetical protein